MVEIYSGLVGMKHPRWLIIVGILVGSLVITGSSTLLRGYLSSTKDNMNAESSLFAIQAQIDQCSSNNYIEESVRDWCDEIVPTANKNSLDPFLVAAIIEVESAGNAKAYSKSGAVGLMQVMPRDGLASQFQCINGPCFASRPSMSELYDPEFNISYGSHYLAGLISHSEGDLRQALMGYGPGDMGYAYADLVLNTYHQYTQ